MESCYEKIKNSQYFIRLRNFENKIQKQKKPEHIHMDSENSINSFGINRIGYLIIHCTICYQFV